MTKMASQVQCKTPPPCAECLQRLLLWVPQPEIIKALFGRLGTPHHSATSDVLCYCAFCPSLRTRPGFKTIPLPQNSLQCQECMGPIELIHYTCAVSPSVARHHPADCGDAHSTELFARVRSSGSRSSSPINRLESTSAQITPHYHASVGTPCIETSTGDFQAALLLHQIHMRSPRLPPPRSPDETVRNLKNRTFSYNSNINNSNNVVGIGQVFDFSHARIEAEREAGAGRVFSEVKFTFSTALKVKQKLLGRKQLFSTYM